MKANVEINHLQRRIQRLEEELREARGALASKHQINYIQTYDNSSGEGVKLPKGPLLTTQIGSKRLSIPQIKSLIGCWESLEKVAVDDGDLSDPKIIEIVTALKEKLEYLEAIIAKVDDAEPGDISFNTYKCSDCNGTGWKDGEGNVLVPRELVKDMIDYGRSGKVAEPWRVEALIAEADDKEEEKLPEKICVWKVIDYNGKYVDTSCGHRIDLTVKGITDATCHTCGGYIQEVPYGEEEL